jgi:hypothetical protein
VTFPEVQRIDRYNYRNSTEGQEELQTVRQSVSIRKDLQILGDSCKRPKEICKLLPGLRRSIGRIVTTLL